MKTPANAPNSKSPKTSDKQLSGKHGIKQRADHQPLLQRQSPLVQAIPTIRKQSHQEKIFTYRDRCLALLQSHLSQELLIKFDERSQQSLFSMPENTEVARYSDLAAYAKFCADHHYLAFPANETTIERYIDHMVSLRRKRSTLDRHMASLIYWNNVLDLDNPTATFAINSRWNHAKRQINRVSEQAEGLRFHHLQQALQCFQPDILRDCADMALLFVAFDSLCRRSELVRFDWSDLAPDPNDGSGLLHLSYSKTDQDGEGHWLYLSATSMRVLNHWQRIANLNNGALFRGVDSGNRLNQRLSDKGVERAFKRIAQRLGFSPRLFSGHSTRVGAAQEMVEANIDTAGILLAGRWSDTRMITRYAKKLNAKHSGAATLAAHLGTRDPASLHEPNSDIPSSASGFLEPPTD
jgi:integrase